MQPPVVGALYMVATFGGAGAFAHCPVAIACKPAGVASHAFITLCLLGK